MDSYEIVVEGRLSAVLVEAAGVALARHAEGRTSFVLAECDQSRLHSVFGLLGDLNIALVSVRCLESPAPHE